MQAAALPAAPTDRLPGYSVGKTIGEGGFCKVRLGIHDLSGQRVAIKVIDKAKLKVCSPALLTLRLSARSCTCSTASDLSFASSHADSCSSSSIPWHSLQC